MYRGTKSVCTHTFNQWLPREGTTLLKDMHEYIMSQWLTSERQRYTCVYIVYTSSYTIMSFPVFPREGILQVRLSRRQSSLQWSSRCWYHNLLLQGERSPEAKDKQSGERWKGRWKALSIGQGYAFCHKTWDTKMFHINIMYSVKSRWHLRTILAIISWSVYILDKLLSQPTY